MDLSDMGDALPINISPSSSPVLDAKPFVPKSQIQENQNKRTKGRSTRPGFFPQAPQNPDSTDPIFSAIPRATRKRLTRENLRRQSAIPSPDAVLITPYSGPLHPEYYFEDKLRKVRPYYFTYNTFAKQRWYGRRIVEVYEDEFRDRTAGYYRNALKTGQIVVNGLPIPPEELDDRILVNGDLITHTLHRHEPPVSEKPIGIIHEDDGILVIDKPAGITVHPSGRYRFNSVTEILRAERHEEGLDPHPCNRLDRLTSGIMFIGKNPVAAERFSQQLKDRSVRKEYVARVLGEFPEGEIVCEEPLYQISPKLGLNAVRASGKDAKTFFKRVAYIPPQEATPEPKAEDISEKHNPYFSDSGQPWKKYKGYSIVRCFPLTGRTHQIRVHLQFLGHPIANDPIYANQRVFGPNLGKWQSRSGGRRKRDPSIKGTDSPPSELDENYPEDETLIERLSLMGKQEVAEAVAYHDELVETFEARKAEKLTGEICPDCGTELYSDPGAHELGIYLHARRYACAAGNWSYETGWPDWAGPEPENLKSYDEVG